MKKIIYILPIFALLLFNGSVIKRPLINNYTQTVQIPTDSLVAYYPIDGNANDESGNGLNGTVYGAYIGDSLNRHEETNTCYYFDGLAYIDLGNVLDINFIDFSISIWFYYTVNGYLIGRESSAKQWGCYMSSDRFTFVAYQDDVTYNIKQSSVLSADQWYHAVVVFNNGDASIYINNIFDNDVSLGTTITSIRSISVNTQIGRRNRSGSYYYLTGKIDDIRIYNKILTTNEITALYNE
jgi:hypothetical protein